MDIVERVRQTATELLASLEGPAVWAGTDASYEFVRRQAEKMLAMSAEDIKAMAAGKDEDEEAGMLTMRGHTAVIDVQGPLLAKGNFFTRMFGMADYPTIRNAFAEAANKPEAKNILFHIDSPGGAVSGANETAKFIDAISSKLKPVTTFSGGSIASAAYWIGVSGKKVVTTEDATVGSIGIFAVHMDRTEEFKKEGLKPEVFRAGKYKNLANPYEPLTEAARKEIQSELDSHYETFTGHVASMLGKPYAQVDDKMAQGRVFNGKKAKDVGLVHKVSTLAETLASMEKNDVDIKHGLNKNPLHVSKGAFGMTKEQLEALVAVGVVLTAEQQAELAAFSAEDSAEEQSETTAAPAAEAAERPAASAAPAQGTEMVAFLRDEVARLQSQIVNLTVEARDAKALVESMKAPQDALVGIVRDSVNRMRVALGGSATDLSAMGAEALVAEHARIAAEFKAKFKTGGAAAVAPEPKDESTAKADAADPRAQSRLAAVKFGAKR